MSVEEIPIGNDAYPDFHPMMTNYLLYYSLKHSLQGSGIDTNYLDTAWKRYLATIEAALKCEQPSPSPEGVEEIVSSFRE